ncbi:MAG: class I SAM-dependent methyltransferase [Candidatus Eisenbacteria bacterium]|nr:class I SAM-dependent methyltransferase [Candidatus Eisenbacteria bacterium]
MSDFERLLCSFQRPAIHQEVSRIIRERSLHPDDIRDLVLRTVDLSDSRRVADLGCGFGYMVEKLALRLPARAYIVGVDACDANRDCFLARLIAARCEGDFLAMQIADTLPWADKSFDLVVCSYTLYFFPEIIRDIARVLRPQGILLAITHEADSLEALFPLTGIAREGALLPTLLHRFSSENGAELLAPHFHEIERGEYHNSLRFLPEHKHDLLTYVQFKLPLLLPRAGEDMELPPEVRRAIDDHFSWRGEAILEKNDAWFVCRRPRWP